MTQDRTEIPDTNQPAPKKPNDPSLRDPNHPKEREMDLPNKASEIPYEKKEVKGEKGTQFDGNPNPRAVPQDIFKPQDDTPAVLDKNACPTKLYKHDSKKSASDNFNI